MLVKRTVQAQKKRTRFSMTTKEDIIQVALVLLIIQCLLAMYGFIYYQECVKMKKISRIVVLQPTNITRQRTQTYVTTSRPNKTEVDLKPRLREKIRFLIEPKKDLNDTCSLDKCNSTNGFRWSMVTFVKSKSDHFAQRETLRRTWASVRIINNAQFRTIFVVGTNPSTQNTNALKNEQKQYGDILQYDGPDDYKNIMLKTLAGMQWASDNLPSNFFYSSADDDVIVNLSALQRQIVAAHAKMNKDGWSEFPLVCAYNIMPHDKPHRERGSKWLIDKNEYPWHVWPPSCFGGFYSTRVSLIARFYEESRALPLLRFDDVWITGIVRQHVGMPSDMVLPPGDANTVHHLEKNENMTLLWEKMLPQLETQHNICLCA